RSHARPGGPGPAGCGRTRGCGKRAPINAGQRGLPMSAFEYRDGALHAEDVPVERLAQAYGTPTYVYSRAQLSHHYQAYAQALAGRPHLVCYAVKANSTLAVLNCLAQLGAGFDIVS